MKKLFYLIAVAGFVMVSCTKPNDNPNPNEEKTYTFSIGAEKEAGNTDETRVEMVDGLMHWSVDDTVQIHVWHPEGGGIGPIIENIAMTGIHTEPTRITTFNGQLTESDLSKFRTNQKYIYVSHYYGRDNALGTPALLYTTKYGSYGGINIVGIPNTGITIPKNEFPTEYVLMCANISDAPPATWLDRNNGEQQFGERMTFTYKHIFAYLRLKIDATNKQVGRISLQNTYSSSSTRTANSLSGSVKVTVSTNKPLVEPNSQSWGYINLTISDNDGLGTGDIVYIPMYPNTFNSSNKLSFEFFEVDRSRSMYTITLPTYPGQVLEAGKIYDISFTIP